MRDGAKLNGCVGMVLLFAGDCEDTLGEQGVPAVRAQDREENGESGERGQRKGREDQGIGGTFHTRTMGACEMPTGHCKLYSHPRAPRAGCPVLVCVQTTAQTVENTKAGLRGVIDWVKEDLSRSKIASKK